MLAIIGKYLIEYYWKTIPASERKVCIHKVSCSNAVYEALNNYGFWIGVKTYLYRRSTCNKDYQITTINEKVIIKTKRGIILQEDEINPIIIKEFKC